MWSLSNKGPKKFIWIDIVKPSRRDVDELRKVHSFHPIILDELLHQSDRAKVESLPGYFYLVYHIPVYDPETRTSRRGEIDFLVTKNHVITVHYESILPIEELKQRLVASADFRDHVFRSTFHILHRILSEIIQFSSRQIRHIESNVEYVSKNIFSGQEREMLEQISYIKRDVLDYSIISEPQEIILESLLEVGRDFWGGPASVYFNDLLGDYGRIIRRLKSFTATIESLETTNGQLLSANINFVIQRFTILAFLTFPLALFFAMIATDYVGAFFLRSPARFWLTFLLILAIEILVVYISKRRKKKI